MRYNVQCTVSGGVTGYRTGLLKSNGEIQFFDTIELAQAECTRLLANVSRYATAHFSYVPVEARWCSCEAPIDCNDGGFVCRPCDATHSQQ